MSSTSTSTNHIQVHDQDWHSHSVNTLKTFVLGGSFAQLKSVKNMLFTITIVGYLHRKGACPVGIWCQNDVVLTSMRRDDVASTSIQRHFDTKCPLGEVFQGWC